MDWMGFKNQIYREQVGGLLVERGSCLSCCQGQPWSVPREECHFRTASQEQVAFKVQVPIEFYAHWDEPMEVSSFA